MTILRIAPPGPMRRLLDYLPPAGVDPGALRPGQRLAIPLGRQRAVGVLVELAEDSELPAAQLRAAEALLDDEPALTPDLLALLRWASSYYHHPLGDCLQQALPVPLRKGEPLWPESIWWRQTALALGLADQALSRAPRRAEALAALADGPRSEAELRSLGISRAALHALRDMRLIESWRAAAPPPAPPIGSEPDSTPELNAEQRQVLAALAPELASGPLPDDRNSPAEPPGRFQCSLLEGVTGSGKTEVYLACVEQVLARGEQVLVLVPEIGLTPQLLARFQSRLKVPVCALHSALADGERLTIWRQIRSGSARVLIGTRSAVFAPLPELGLIVVDEEHDASFKQQEGFRYHARDLAIKRAADRGCPILLGSATPSLESLAHAHSGRYRHLRLTQRAGAAQPPQPRILDIRHVPLEAGLAAPVFSAIRKTLDEGNQALVFLNRRGFAPVLQCHDCGWLGECGNCDARLTVHAARRRLICHHCGAQQRLPEQCPGCRSSQLESQGPGTEQLEQVLTAEFPDRRILRIDRDTTARKHALADMVAEVQRGQPAILVGTQMLAKGHHFPAVTLVAIVDADGGLFSADFRGPERTGQLLLQVAGRAGRDVRRGEVIIQTHHPDHPLLQTLLNQGYAGFAELLLEERRQRGLPPTGHLALLRAEGRQLEPAEQFLADLRQVIVPRVTALGPLPAPMARRAGRYRAQLLLAATERAPLHHALAAAVRAAEAHPLAGRLRWSIDVDPQEMG